MKLELAFLAAALGVAAVEARTVTIASCDHDTGAVELALDAGADGEGTRALLAAWNPSDAGADATAWRETALVANVDAAATSASFTIPADWRGKSGAVRFFLMERTAPYAKRFTSLRTPTASCWIDTGVVPNTDTDISVTACYPGDVAPFGVSGKLYFFSNSWKAGSGNTTGNYYLGFFGAKNGGLAFEGPRSATSPMTYRINSTGVMIDGVNYIVFDPATEKETTTSTLTLFARKNDGQTTVGKNGDMTICSAQIRSAGELTHDYVPCEKDDGTKTLYDRVAGAFCAVSGSGTFTAGTEVGPAAVDCGAVESATDAVRLAPALAVVAQDAAAGTVTVAVSGAHDAGLLFAVADDEDRGTDLSAWAERALVCKVDAEAESATGELPAAWWAAGKAVRLIWKSAGGFGYDRELDYVESAGQAFVNTGWTVTMKTEVAVTAKSAADICHFGLTTHFYLFTNGGSTFWGFFGKSGSFATYNPNNDFHELRLGPSGAYLDGVQKAAASSMGTTYVKIVPTLAIPFRRTYDNTTDWSKTGLCRVRSGKIWERGELVRDFVACEKDGVAGLYDRVYGTFYPSGHSTAVFDAGPEVLPAVAAEEVLAWSGAASLASEISAVWDGGGADRLLTTAANWAEDVAPNLVNASATPVFATGGTKATLAEPAVVRGLVFNARNDFEVDASGESAVLTLGPGGIMMVDDPAENIPGSWRFARFNCPLELGADQTWDLSANSKRRIQIDAKADLRGAAERTLTVTGQGTLGLFATNSYAGNVQVNGGTLKIISKKQPFGSGAEGGKIYFNQSTGAVWNQFGATIDKPLVVLGANRSSNQFYTNGENGYGTNWFTAPVTVQQDVFSMLLNGPTVFSGGLELKVDMYVDGVNPLVFEGRPVTRTANQRKMVFINAKEIHVRSAGNSVSMSFTDGNTKSGNQLHLWTVNAFDYWCELFLGHGTTLDLHGNDQVCGVLSMASADDRVTSEQPADLFCFYDSDKQQYLKGQITGAITFRKSGKGTASLQGANTSTGALVAQNGRLVLGAGGSWASTDIQIGREDSNRKPTLQVSHNDVFADPRHTVITMTTTKSTDFYTDCGDRPPVLQLDTGVEIRVKNIVIDGHTLAAGWWGGPDSDAEHKDATHFAGSGKVFTAGTGTLLIFR